MRKQTFVSAIDTDFTLGSHLAARDEKAVRKTVSGLLKILHPHGEWSHGDLREYLEFGLEGRRRVKEQLKKLAAHDYAKTAFSYIENDTSREVWIEVPEQPEEFRTVDIVDPEDISEPSTRQTTDLITAGESKTVEFKRTARFNEHTGATDKVLEHGVVKSVAGFMNASGGTLLIGVHDDRYVTGLDNDYNLTGARGRDGFENWLVTKLEHELGKPAISSWVDIGFEEVDGHDVCRIDASMSTQPVYLGEQADFYVRMGNSTRLFNTREALEYVQQRW